MPTEHAKYSPSSAYRWLNCPGFIVYKAMIPDKPPSKDSERGTFVHAVCEKCLLLGIDPKKLLGKWFNYHVIIDGIKCKRRQKVTKDVVFAARQYYNYVVNKANGAKLYVEKKVKLTKNLWGTVDCSFVKKDTLYVVDYKNGYGLVSPKNNPQLMIYGLAALKELKNPKIKNVCLVICQPNGEGDTIKESLVSARKLKKRFWPQLKEGIRRIENEPLDLNIGPWCKWCEVGRACPERHRFVRNLETVDLETVSIGELQEIYEQKENILDYFKQIEDLFLRVIMHGAKIETHKVVKKRATAVWKKDQDTLFRLLKKRGFSDKYIQENIVNTKIRTPGQLRSVLGDKLVDKWSEKRSSGVKLVKASDPGDPVNSLIEDFED